MNHSVPQNPESHVSIVPYAVYNNHKNARKQIQSQRQQAQHTISFLERQAKKTARQLEMRQKSLLNYYHLKQSRFEDSQNKNRLKRKRQDELERQRKTNTLLRETSAANKSMAQNYLMNSNKRSASDIKRERSQSERKLTEQKQLERQLLRKRNTAFSKALSLGTQHAKVKSLFFKNHQSSAVKNDLIYVQQNIKSRQISKINHLNQKQKELLGIIEKNKKQKKHYDSTFEQFQTLPFEQLYPTIKSNTNSKRTTSRKSSIRSESHLV